jgi:UDP-N-acetylglucosamine--N-acetylmuramyl-(pentapeptide) pyrophosphoryl-undecaprenol N-acetylglucosamine transferase
MRILFTGGGTGGHIFPIVALIREIKRIAEDEQILGIEFYYAGPVDFGEKEMLEEGIIIIPIAAGKWRRYFSLANFTDLFKIPVSILQAIWNVFLLMPDVVFSKGGYGAFPVIVAAAIFRIPIIIHESDSVPGKVNLFSARFAKRIGIAFRSAADYFPKDKTAWVGVPIRKRILGGARAEAKEELDIYSDYPVIGIIGASQGAEKINATVMEILKELTDEYEVVHQTGDKNLEAVEGEASIILEFGHKERYRAFGFLEEGMLRNFYQVADLIVARASATVIFEIAAWAKPAILIPLRNSAQDHQRRNAYEYAATGAAIVIEEENLTPHILLAEIRKILGNEKIIKKMKESAQSFARIDSSEIIAREILKLGLH